MCGIFGITGTNTSAPDITFKGLLDIEYRGYDSWGVAYLKDNQFEVKKEIGFLPKLPTFPQAEVAIGHTRWATHGGVTELNAHPHTDCDKKLVLVHNGIIENYQDLKKTLTGHKFLSQTDTEIAVHLIEEEYKTTKNLKDAVTKVFSKVEGLNAFVVTDGKSIVAVKNGSPLVAGISPEGFLVASDPNALLPHTKKLLFMEDNQLIEIAQDLKLFDIKKGTELTPEFTTVDWSHESSDLKDFKHFMLKEIFEQPKLFRSIAKNSSQVDKVAELIKKAYGTYFIGCGTASYAALEGVYLFSKFAKKHVNFSIGSEFEYIQDFIVKKSLVVAVSQSGETIDVIQPVIFSKKKGANIVALTNVLGSTLYRMADEKLMLLAGPEKAVCGTKSFTTMVANILLLSFKTAGNIKDAEKILEKSATATEKILNEAKIIQELSDKIYQEKNIYILGRGLSYPLALEAALKIKEVSYIHAEGFAGGELKHGVMALIEKNTPVIVFVPEDETKSAILASAEEVRARGARVIGIGAESNPVFDFFYEVADTGASSILPHIVFVQLLAYYLAIKLNLNPDKPRNLAKSVTVK